MLGFGLEQYELAGGDVLDVLLVRQLFLVEWAGGSRAPQLQSQQFGLVATMDVLGLLPLLAFAQRAQAFQLFDFCRAE